MRLVRSKTKRTSSKSLSSSLRKQRRLGLVSKKQQTMYEQRRRRRRQRVRSDSYMFVSVYELLFDDQKLLLDESLFSTNELILFDDQKLVPDELLVSTNELLHLLDDDVKDEESCDLFMACAEQWIARDDAIDEEQLISYLCHDRPRGLS